MGQIRFDDSLPTLAKVVVSELGAEALSQGCVLRDISGRLAFFAPGNFEGPRLERARAHA
jgi:hypothetical protein